jgi:dTDP-4-amino-4,6-dideoxygalactose transaminase
MSSIVIENYDRDKIFKYLKKSNIDIRPTFPVISEYPIWGNDVVSESDNAKNIALYGINLPSGVTLSRDEIRYVSAVLKSAII